MAASYPSSIHPYANKIDLVDVVLADNVNSLQDEVRAVETVLGSAAEGQNPLVATYAGSFTTATTTWSTVSARLRNIEAGLVGGVSSGPYVAVGGGSTITTATNKGLVLKTGAGSLNLLEAYSLANVLGFNLDSSGIPKVATNNVLYVNSTEYNTMNTTITNNYNTLNSGKLNLSTVTTAGDLLIGTGSATIGRLGIGTNGYILKSNGTTATWAAENDTSKIALSTVTTAGDLIIGTGSGAVARLGIGTNGQVLTSNGTTATWGSPSSSFVSQTNGTVTTASTSSGVVRNTYISTSAPTGGIDGDVWLVYI